MFGLTRARLYPRLKRRGFSLGGFDKRGTILEDIAYFTRAQAWQRHRPVDQRLK